MNNHRMSCGEAREKLLLYVGGDLDPDVLEAVRVHVEICAECTRRAEEATRARRALVAAFRSWEADHQKPELWSGIRATLRAEGLIHAPDAVATPGLRGERRSGVRSKLRGRWTLVLAPAAAAAALLALVQLSGVFFEHPDGKILPNPVGPRVERGPEIAGTTPVSAPGTVDLETGLFHEPANSSRTLQYWPLPQPQESFGNQSSPISNVGLHRLPRGAK